MEFCPRCGSIIIAKEGKFVCAKCGYKPKGKIKIEASEKITNREAIAVVKEGQDNTNPVIEIICPKCKNKKAFFWTKQTRSSDESETKFYQCTKCQHTWRVYR